MKYEYLIAIDPSVNKSGVCVYNLKQKCIERLESKKLWDLFQDFRLTDPERVFFFVENSNLVKGNWHGKTARGNVGKNKGISQNIADCLKDLGLNYLELKPDGYSQYFKNEEKFKTITGFEGRSNKDNRAAAAMIYRNTIKVKAIDNL